MAFQFNWKKRINGISDAMADDVNYLADGIEELQAYLQELEGGNVAFDELYYDRSDGYLHVRKDGVDIVAPQFIGILSEKKMTLTDVSKIYDKATDVEVSELLFSGTALAYPNVVNELSTKEDGIKLYIMFSSPHSIGDIYAYNVLGDKSITLQFQPFIQGTNENITLYFDGAPVGDEWGNFVIDVKPNHCVAIEYDGERYNILGEYGDDTQISLTDGTHKAIFPQFDKDRNFGDMIWKNASDFTTNEGAIQVTGSGDISFSTNKKYAVTLTGDASFHFPTDGLSSGISHSILIDLFMDMEYSVNFTDSEYIMYEDGNTPIVSAGNYRIEAFFDPNVLKWCIRVDSYKYDWSEALGLRVDFENSVFERLEAAEGKNVGAFFDGYTMYGGRKRCNVADDGTILAYDGDEGYKTDGSNGQVMVYQPAFYYNVVPLILDGVKIRKAEYYVSEKPLVGFKRHPAFYDTNGNEIDYILLSAYEACIYDTDAGVYLLNNEQVADFSTDKLSSIAGAIPASNGAQNLTKANAQALAQNRGEGWHIDHILSWSAQQLLALIERGTFDMQASSGNGIVIESVIKPTGSIDHYEGATSANKNGYTTAMRYRWCENLFGNINTYVGGVDVDNGYVLCGLNYSSGQSHTNLQVQIAGGLKFISAFSYDENFDWMFVPCEHNGTSVEPVGDMCYGTRAINADTWMVGGDSVNPQSYYQRAGLFTINTGDNAEKAWQGSRLLFVPTAETEGEA